MKGTHKKKAHTGHTKSGSTRDIKIQRIASVTVYKRGKNYYLYYRDNGRSVRRKVEGNLATARAMASRVSAAVEEGRPSPRGFTPITVADLVDSFIDSCESVQGLAVRTVDRYRAALSHFKRFAQKHSPSSTADKVTPGSIEDFVKWLRRQSRTRNGAVAGEPTR